MDYEDLIRRIPGYTVAAAMDDAQSSFEDDFESVFGLEAKAAPPSMTHDEWIEARRIHGLAKQIANVAVTLLKQKGIGQKKLDSGTPLAAAAREYELQLEDFFHRHKAQIPDSTLGELRAALDWLRMSDPRVARILGTGGPLLLPGSSKRARRDGARGLGRCSRGSAAGR